MTDDLIAFLRTCLKDEEEAARRSATLLLIVHTDRVSVPNSDEESTFRHFDRYTPKRVLAEVDAKRRIIEAAEEASGLDMQVDGEFRVGTRDAVGEPYIGDVILRALALPYADRPGYRDEWRP